MQLSVIQFTIKMFHIGFMQVPILYYTILILYYTCTIIILII